MPLNTRRVPRVLRWSARVPAGIDEPSDLLKFDDVGPVGDDPIATGVLDPARVDEPLLQFCRMDVGASDPLDEFALIGGRGRDQLLELGAPIEELDGERTATGSTVSCCRSVSQSGWVARSWWAARSMTTWTVRR